VPALFLEHGIDMVIPSLDETLAGWAERRNALQATANCHVIVSPVPTITTFQDKWKSYQFFCENGFPCPATSLQQDFALVKPRFGRGGTCVSVPDALVNMDDMISQEFLEGTEYTIDVFCDKDGDPVYIVPRRRIEVQDGKSTGGKVQVNSGIAEWIRAICSATKFVGPVNMQCFIKPDGDIRFVEVNPRIAGGMALGIAATENWVALIEAVGFDLDGTLCDEQDFIAQVYCPIAGIIAELAGLEDTSVVYGWMLNRWREEGRSYRKTFSESIRNFAPDTSESRVVSECLHIFRGYKPHLSLGTKVAGILNEV
jgi:hypothetical protein